MDNDDYDEDDGSTMMIIANFGCWYCRSELGGSKTCFADRLLPHYHVNINIIVIIIIIIITIINIIIIIIIIILFLFYFKKSIMFESQ